MSIPCRSRTWGLRTAFYGFLVALLPACSPTPIAAVDSNEFTSSIWMLVDPVRERDGKTISCLPMLMEVSISTTDVTIGQRAFPCGSVDVFSPEAVTLQRSGTSLRLAETNVGTLLDRSMDITLPGDAGRISWDWDRLDAPYQETMDDAGMSVRYSAKPELRADESPVAISFPLAKPEDKLLIGRMHAATLPGAAIAYVHVYGPTRGELQHFDPLTGDFRILPDKDFAGYDRLYFSAVSFSFKSKNAIIDITYLNSPDPPIVDVTFVEVNEDTSITFKPDAFDPDGDPLTFTILTPPKHGMASTEGKTMTYTPVPNYNGLDKIEYLADDGTSKTDPSTIEITVFSEDDPPIAISQDVTVTSDSATPLTLQAFDLDSTDLLFELENMTTLGKLLGEAPHLVYVPNPGVNGGSESLAFHVTDGTSLSPSATVNITIAPGPYAATLLSQFSTHGIHPELTAGSRLYYWTNDPPLQSMVGATDGTTAGTVPLQSAEIDTFGFDNNMGGIKRTIF